MMRMKKFYFAACAFLLCAAVVFAALDMVGITLSGDGTADNLIYSCLQTGLAGAFVAAVSGVLLRGKSYGGRPAAPLRAAAWCLPCLGVALANFPFSALICGQARVDRVDLVALFALSCILTALFEEYAFRGLLQSLATDALKDRRTGEIYALLIVNALFGAWHLFNLLDGAGVGATFMQAGYSFLLGCMLSAMRIRTGSLWPCMVIHALFNFGGLLIPQLGSGRFQDTAFWTATAICGTLAAAHVCAYLIRRALKKPPVAEKN